MNDARIRGIVALIIGFVISVIVGVVLSFLAIDILSPTQVIIAGIITFLAVSPIFGYGVYSYARSIEDDSLATNEEMEKPRLLLDILRETPHGDVVTLAEQLDTTPDNIRAYIVDLNQLQLFSGIADWDNGVVAMVNPTVMLAIDRCRTCDTPINTAHPVTICPNCGTEYYISNAS